MAANLSTNRRWARWVIGALVALVVIFVGGILFIRFVVQSDPPPKLTLPDVTSPSGASGNPTASTPLAGTWKVGSGSTAGYRVKETLFGQSNTAVGRTSQVSGSMTIDGTTVTKAAVTVDMTSVHTVGNSLDSAFADRRDGQFQGRIMNTDQFPTATFTLTQPISLAPVPEEGVVKHYSAKGKLTLHGTTKNVTFPLTARRTGDVIAVQGITTITFSDYGIDNPSGGPASVGDSGQLEFVVQMQPS